MDLKQFRIGNYVGEHEFATNGFVHKIERIDCYCVPGEIIFSNGDTSSKPFGVELDEEWLKKFGFKDLSTKTITRYYNSNHSLFKINRKGNKFILFGYRNYPSPIEYVHQLQNLYFALTGNELINLSAVGKAKFV